MAETRFTLEEMKEILRIRCEMVLVPKCLPHKFGGDRRCRYKCDHEEDIKHAIECTNDSIDNKIIKEEDIANIINDKYDKTLKTKLKDFKRIINIKMDQFMDEGRVSSGDEDDQKEKEWAKGR